MNNASSITSRIKSALSSDISPLIDAVINQTREIKRQGDSYCIEVDEGHEKLALQLRNSLKNYGYEFNLKRHRKGYRFTIYGNIMGWISELREQNSSLLESMEFS